MDLFRDKHLLKKEYFENKPTTPEEEDLLIIPQPNLNPTSPKPGSGGGRKDKNNKTKDAPNVTHEEPERAGRVLGQEALAGKIVGLYFSAGWCPPCQTFISLLAGLYDEQNRKATNISLFCIPTMDLFRDKHLLKKEYFENKPASPEEEDLLITPQPNLNPTSPKPGSGGGRKDKNNKTKDAPNVTHEEPERAGRALGQEALAGKIVGLFFSAGWCPPCQTFISLLAGLYDELQNRKANFEVVFLSFDKNADEMERYFLAKHRDWLALPFDDPLKDELKLKYNVTAVPRFIVIQRDGELITARGRKEVQDKGVICFRNWQQAHVVHEAKVAQAALAASAQAAAMTEGQEGEGEGTEGTEKREPTVTFQIQ